MNKTNACNFCFSIISKKDLLIFVYSKKKKIHKLYYYLKFNIYWKATFGKVYYFYKLFVLKIK